MKTGVCDDEKGIREMEGNKGWRIMQLMRQTSSI